MSEQKRFVLIGLGAYGTEIARTLLEHDADFIVMDRDPLAVSQMKAAGCKFAVQIDNLDPSALSKFIKAEDTVILSMGDAFESQILTVELLKQIGVKTIYARATKDIQHRILEKMDITEILFPEKQEGRRFALKLLNKDFHFVTEFSSDIFLIEVPVGDELAGKTILHHEIRTRFNVNIVGLKSRVETKEKKEPKEGNENGEEDCYITEYVGFETKVLEKGQILLVIGREEDLSELVRTLGKKDRG
jgi:trk system potassium uptake protein TrkA